MTKKEEKSGLDSSSLHDQFPSRSVSSKAGHSTPKTQARDIL